MHSIQTVCVSNWVQERKSCRLKAPQVRLFPELYILNSGVMGLNRLSQWDKEDVRAFISSVLCGAQRKSSTSVSQALKLLALFMSTQEKIL